MSATSRFLLSDRRNSSCSAIGTGVLSASKPNRMAKAEGINLHLLLVDTPPELTIENGSMGMHALRQTFETFSYAMAMVELAHLATLKQYYLRFIQLMTSKLDTETGLRNPTILEAQSADKTLMTIVCELVMERRVGNLTTHCMK